MGRLRSPRAHVIAALVVVFLGVTCGGEGAVDCPPGWAFDDRYVCQPPQEFLDQLHATMTSGVYGFVVSMNGSCSDDSTGPSGCSDSREECGRLVGGLVITAYAAVDVLEAPTAECPNGYVLASGAEPIAVTTTDADGVYSLALPYGSNNLTAVDPIDHCDSFVSPAYLSETLPLRQVDITFDHSW